MGGDQAVRNIITRKFGDQNWIRAFELESHRRMSGSNAVKESRWQEGGNRSLRRVCSCAAKSHWVTSKAELYPWSSIVSPFVLGLFHASFLDDTDRRIFASQSMYGSSREPLPPSPSPIFAANLPLFWTSKVVNIWPMASTHYWGKYGPFFLTAILINAPRPTALITPQSEMRTIGTVPNMTYIVLLCQWGEGLSPGREDRINTESLSELSGPRRNERVV